MEPDTRQGHDGPRARGRAEPGRARRLEAGGHFRGDVQEGHEGDARGQPLQDHLRRVQWAHLEHAFLVGLRGGGADVPAPEAADGGLAGALVQLRGLRDAARDLPLERGDAKARHTAERGGLLVRARTDQLQGRAGGDGAAAEAGGADGLGPGGGAGLPEDLLRRVLPAQGRKVCVLRGGPRPGPHGRAGGPPCCGAGAL
mmetsp:Transcript_8205/g.24152  ORF Transcript_8205/g.24152 Transcript_8205/m.24152 type:complete len:200 (-) Transcript_8205:964-1563(-)